MKEKLTQDRLKELLSYDPETGIFTWKVDRTGKAKKGSRAGNLNKTNGYWIICVDNKRRLAHRLAILYIDGYLPENSLDHIDRNKINNRYNNLREVSQTCNSRNCNIAKNNKSGITGVSWHKKKNKWQSQINIPKPINIGVFDSFIDAVKARWEAEVKYNFPNCNTTSSAYNYLKEHGVL